MNINNPTTFSTPNLTLSTSNSSGTAGSLRADDTILVYDAVVPTTVTQGASAAAGSAAVSARRDHTHGAGTFSEDISCRLRDASGQSIANNTPTDIAFDTELFDTDTMHDNTTNNTRITFKTEGKYLVGGGFEMGANTSGIRAISITEGGDTTIAYYQDSAAAEGSPALFISTLYNFAVDEYITLNCKQTSGGALSTSSGGIWSPQFWAVKVVG